MLEIDFKTKNNKQLLAMNYWVDNSTEQILYGGAKGGGKSYLGVSAIFGDALIYPGTHYFIARSELNDLRKFTIPTIHEVFRNWGLEIDKYASYNGQDSVFNLYNGSKVYLLSCKPTPADPLFERFGSMQMTRGMIEEGGEIVESAKDNLWISIGRWQNEKFKLKKKLLITANPKKGWMKKEFVDPAKKKQLPSTMKYIQAFAHDNAYLSKDYIESLRHQKSAIARQRLFLGNWDYDDSKDSIVSGDALLDMQTNTVDDSDEIFLTVDVARFGKDFTVYIIWRGLRAIRIIKKHKKSTEQTKVSIKEYAIEYKIPYSHIMVDEDGIGGAVVDGLVGIRGFVANSSPLPTTTEIRTKQSKIQSEYTPKINFKNLKAQCGWKCAELINEHKISIDIQNPELFEELTEDLEATLKEKDPDSDGKLQLKSKKEVKVELGRSPDVGDCVLMRSWFEVYENASETDPHVEERTAAQRDQFYRNMKVDRSNK